MESPFKVGDKVAVDTEMVFYGKILVTPEAVGDVIDVQESCILVRYSIGNGLYQDITFGENTIPRLHKE